MTDLWYTYGAMVADPGLLAAIGATNPKFSLIGMNVTETPAGQAPLIYTRPAAGYLNGDSTTQVRETIRDYVTAKLPAGAPPISLYTAGKMCQLWNTHKGPFQASIATAHAAFSKAIGKLDASTALLTIVGLCLLDTNFVTGTLLGTDQGAIDDSAREFNLDRQGGEWKALQSLIKDPDFGKAHKALFTAPCWDGLQACAEVIMFYGNFIRAVN